MSKVIDSIELYYREGGSDKIYKASITEDASGFMVCFAYGRRGNSLTEGCKTKSPVGYSKALEIYEALVKEKTSKGYTPIEGAKPYTGNDPVESRDTGIRPQLLNEIKEKDLETYLTDDLWCAEEKYDGVRRMVISSKETVVGTNRKGLSVVLPADFMKEVHNLAASKSFILDGEQLGDVYMVFDFMDFDKSMKDRYQILEDAFNFKDKKTIKLAPIAWTTKEKRDLLKRLRKNNAEGIVFKKVSSNYTSGRPNSGGSQVKFKFVSTASCVVTKNHDSKSSVSLCVYDTEGDPIEVGNVTVYPNQIMPKPGSIVEVRYLYYFPGGSLFQPVLIGTREDIDISDCTLSQLKAKREEVDV